MSSFQEKGAIQPGQRRLTGFVQPQPPEPAGTDDQPDAADTGAEHQDLQQRQASGAPVSVPPPMTSNTEWQPLPAAHPKYTAGQSGVWRWTAITRRSERQAAGAGADLIRLGHNGAGL